MKLKIVLHLNLFARQRMSVCACVSVCEKVLIAIVPTNGFCHTSRSTRSRQMIYMIISKMTTMFVRFSDRQMYACFRANAKMRCAHCFMQNICQNVEQKWWPTKKKLKTDCAFASLSNCLVLCAFRLPSEKGTI